MALVLADLKGWMGLSSTPAEVDVQLQRALDAAIERVESRCGTLPTEWPAAVALATLMQAARYAKRASSPEGVAGFGDLGVVRVSALDPDVEMLLSEWLSMDGFA